MRHNCNVSQVLVLKSFVSNDSTPILTQILTRRAKLLRNCLTIFLFTNVANIGHLPNKLSYIQLSDIIKEILYFEKDVSKADHTYNFCFL